MRKLVGRVLAAVLPWPSKADRRAAVDDARGRAVLAQQQAGEARSLIAELHELRRRNHVSEALDQIIWRRFPGSNGDSAGNP